MNRYRVLNLFHTGEPVYEIMRREMPELLELVVLESGGRSEIISRVKEADFAIAVKMDAETIAAASRLKLIQLAGVGFDGIDLGAATRAGIPVAQTVEGTIIGVAEHTVLLMLAVYRRLLEADAAVRRGEWPFWQLRPTSFELADKTVGIVGLGRIGREVAHRVRAFGARIVYHDVRPAEGEFRYLPLEELLRTADIVTLHAPLLSETRRLIGERELRLMKPTAVLINTARGGLVDEAALVRALTENRIGGAGLDVFDREPTEPANPLLALKNTVLTPHIATGTRESIIGKTRGAVENFLRVIRGEPPVNVVNPEVYGKQ